MSKRKHEKRKRRVKERSVKYRKTRHAQKLAGYTSISKLYQDMVVMGQVIVLRHLLEE